MNSVLLNTILTATGLAIACALLSVVVVVCRWAFIGEGISHSGFGGAGTAWLLMLIFPSLDQTWMPYLSLVIFCLLTSVGIGLLSRARGVNADAAIGVFLVASLAWGFLCQQIYSHVRHATPVSFDNLLWGRMIVLSAPQAHAAILVCVAVILILVVLAKEILAYCFDPQLAACSGVRARFIHYLLMLLIAVTIIIGAQLVGTVLVTALLVLPGAAALRITRQLSSVVCISIVVALVGTLGGLLLSNTWTFLPPGPLIVLLMLMLFLIALIVTALEEHMKLREFNTPSANPVDNLPPVGIWPLIEPRPANSLWRSVDDLVSPSLFPTYASVMSLTGCPQKYRAIVALNSLVNNHLSEITGNYPQKAVVHHHYCFRLVHLIDS